MVDEVKMREQFDPLALQESLIERRAAFAAGGDIAEINRRAIRKYLDTLGLDAKGVPYAAHQSATEQMRSQHPDDAAVDRFAAAMKEKLAKKRADGRGGWEDKTRCSQQFLSELLFGHVQKGDPVDVANLAMMLHQRGEGILPNIAEQVKPLVEALREIGRIASPDKTIPPEARNIIYTDEANAIRAIVNRTLAALTKEKNNG